MDSKKKFRILAASDIHGESRVAERLAKKAEREHADLVVLCGDITGFRETKNFIKPFTNKKQKVLILPGNWDSFATADFLAELYGVRNIHGYSVRYQNIGFFGAGGAEGPGEGRASEKEILATLKKAYSGLKIKGIEKKIMITHEHPSGSKSEFSGVPGNKSITWAIKNFKPDILIHGHIHEGAGIEETIGKTKVFNVGKEGRIIDI